MKIVSYNLVRYNHVGLIYGKLLAYAIFLISLPTSLPRWKSIDGVKAISHFTVKSPTVMLWAFDIIFIIKISPQDINICYFFFSAFSSKCMRIFFLGGWMIMVWWFVICSICKQHRILQRHTVMSVGSQDCR